ncbi:RCC1 BLIP-II [Coniophora puteana RWD-64-598 SS2]|uniref:RCC1 BLIP-II n=1 Tax=Coniophora puteana (strain RWD-64-598) TaxID=741705 RepID=A0A5M3M903_CONPW|nr:RCC1 BLIP-II [Coniophora puteana RWD-64-598 SS2]EIW75324.1 RCC1 BLIP-II [Coniophora puteana RWD-64-598 SS2]
MATTSLRHADTDGEQTWGRVLICGGTDWPKLGRKDRGGKAAGGEDEDEAPPDLLEPHILRSLSNVKIASIHTSCASCHCIALDIHGTAYMFGRNAPQTPLGVPQEVVSEQKPRKLTAPELGAGKGTRFVHAACGRYHSLLVDSEGDIWSAGANNVGQCGHETCSNIPGFRKIESPEAGGVKQRVIKAAAGITFSVILTENGRVFTFGSGEKGQLGNGRTGEHIVTGNKTAFDIEVDPIPVKGLNDKVITDIACGQQHAVAIDEKNVVYVWGYNGYCRLGLGNQQDVLVPKAVPQFAGPNESGTGKYIAAGPSSTIVVDQLQAFWMAGKWKNSGEGSSGSPYSSFRPIQDLMGIKVLHASSGGVTHFALATEEEGVMTVAWGQGASNGELGLGPEEPKSTSKPTRHMPLSGIDVLSVAAGQNTTYILARPSASFSDLPRHPYEVEAPELCMVCEVDKGDDDPALECDKCDHPYHLGCLNPPLDAVPEGEWFCPACDAQGVPVADTDAVTKGVSKKRKGGGGTDEGASKRKK